MSRAVERVRGLLAAVVAPPAAGREGPFAQFGEDEILDEIFGGATSGYCVEVGAYDGVTGSATYLFERKGWDCLLIEPLPEAFERIKANRRAIARNCAVSSSEGEATFAVAENVEQMSTLRLTPEHDRWIEDVGGSVREIVVPTATLDSLLDDAGFPRIDFMTIDVEGHELEVLRGLSLEERRPRILIIEDNSEGGDSEVADHLARRGYVNFKRTGVNDWYAPADDADLAGPDALRRFRRRQRIERARTRVVAGMARAVPRRARDALNRFVQGV